MTYHGEIGYLNLARDIRAYGSDSDDRTGVGTKSLFGEQLRFNLADGFPLLTTKRVHTKSIVHELLWFLSGSTNVKYLRDNGVTIWDEWADENGDLGPVYGKQWRSWEGPAKFNATADFATGLIDDDEGEFAPGKTIDQISNLIEGLRNNPTSRRHIVSAWNPAEVDQCALPPCHCLFQFRVRKMKIGERHDYVPALKLEGEYDGLLSKKHGIDAAVSDVAAQMHSKLDEAGAPRYYLDCQLYQRSDNERLH